MDTKSMWPLVSLGLHRLVLASPPEPGVPSTTYSCALEQNKLGVGMHGDGVLCLEGQGQAGADVLGMASVFRKEFGLHESPHVT